MDPEKKRINKGIFSLIEKSTTYNNVENKQKCYFFLRWGAEGKIQNCTWMKATLMNAIQLAYAKVNNVTSINIRNRHIKFHQKLSDQVRRISFENPLLFIVYNTTFCVSFGSLVE